MGRAGSLYFGDSIFDDVAVPGKFAAGCDTVAIVEEVEESSRKELSSNVWDSFFADKQMQPTFFFGLVRKYSKLAIPCLDHMTGFDLNYAFPTFSQKEGSRGVVPGFKV